MRRFRWGALGRLSGGSLLHIWRNYLRVHPTGRLPRLRLLVVSGCREPIAADRKTRASMTYSAGHAARTPSFPEKV